MDELFALKNLFYTGSFQQVINEANSRSQLSETAKLERKIYLYRAYIAQGKYNLVISDIKSSDEIDLQVIKILAIYLQAKTTSGGSGSNGSVGEDKKKEEALKELREVILNLAKRELASTKTWSEDAMLAQLIEGWVGLRTGGDKYQEAYYICEEIAQSPSSNTVKILNGQAVCNIHLGKHAEAETLLLEALNKSNDDPDTLVNLIVVSNLLNKPAEVVNRYINQLKEASPNHAFLQDLDLKSTKEAAEVTEDYGTENYGKLKLNQSQERTGVQRTRIADINASRAGETVSIRARVYTSRSKSAKLAFFVFRQQVSTIQGVLAVNETNISKAFVKFAANVPAESIVIVEGIINKTTEAITGTTVSDAELHIKKFYVVSETIGRLPFSLEDASRSEEEFKKDEAQYSRVALETRLNSRVVDLRTLANQGIFRIQSGVCQLFREFLLSKFFIEIHTPKLLGAASEGGANVFKVQYFKGEAYLAQSPQLYKQMCICSDFERVFEIAPVFRAEDSNTHRHMTEFVGLDLEMAFEEHYHEVLEILQELLVFVFNGLKNRFSSEIEAVKKQYPSTNFEFLQKTLSTEKEKTLGRLVKEKYNTDFYIVDKFPLGVRPFYTMPDPNDDKYSNSFDFFMRGQEILSGGQRVHDPVFLEERAKSNGVEISTIQPYIDSFKRGVPPHAGGGIGLERVVMLYLNLDDIRRSSLFPRDPKRLDP
ncbi:10908_t:CDS:10 [Rhizophagus irregularis]|nr:10908_t:CDS:10 [Rhizophagus irregularis]